MTISAASKKFGVPRSTLSDHIHDKVKGPQGGPAMLSKEEEQALVDYMLYMSRHNFPVTRDDIRSTIIVGCPSIYMNYSINKLKNICEWSNLESFCTKAVLITHITFVCICQELVKRSGMERIATCKFNLHKGPGNEWFSKFHARHPELKWTKPQSMDRSRIHQCTEYVIDDFFNKYGGYHFVHLLGATYWISLKMEKLTNCTLAESQNCSVMCYFTEALLKKLKLEDKPSCIFNADETGISSQASSNTKAYGERGCPLYQQKVS